MAAVAAMPSHTIVINEAERRREHRFICAPDASAQDSKVAYGRQTPRDRRQPDPVRQVARAARRSFT
jgi:hypothetical protein